MTPWALEVPIGYRVGRWEVTAPIATGSWGSVYAAQRRTEGAAGAGSEALPESAEALPESAEALPESAEALPERVALKFLPTGTASSRQLAHLTDIAERERARHTRLQHPRLVPTYEVLTVADPGVPALDGAVVLVMALAEQSLAARLADSARPVPADQAVRWLGQVAEGLAYVHAAGWVHGDVRPSNVLVLPDGSCCLGDFGLAGELEGSHALLPPAAAAEFTPPERWNAAMSVAGHEVRPSSDVWAFGVLTCLVLSGRSPFPGQIPSARAAAAAEYAAGAAPLLLDPELDAGWRCLIEDCLEPDPADRPTMAMVLRRIRVLTAPAEGRRLTSTPIDGVPAQRGARSGLRRQLSGITWAAGVTVAAPAALLAALLTVGVQLAGGSDYPFSRERPQSIEPSSDPADAGPSPSEPAEPSSAAIRLAKLQAALRAGSVSPEQVAEEAADLAKSTCFPRTDPQQDVSSKRRWKIVWFCGNDFNAAVFATAASTAKVGWMYSSTSWFVCYRHGQPHAGGNDVWYYTQGDSSAKSWERLHAWGFVPAANVHTSSDPYPGLPECPAGLESARS